MCIQSQNRPKCSLEELAADAGNRTQPTLQAACPPVLLRVISSTELQRGRRMKTPVCSREGTRGDMAWVGRGSTVKLLRQMHLPQFFYSALEAEVDTLYVRRVYREAHCDDKLLESRPMKWPRRSEPSHTTLAQSLKVSHSLQPVRQTRDARRRRRLLRKLTSR